MGLESDAAWLRHEANQHFARLDEVAREIQSPRRTTAQKAGYVALMASDLCGVLSEIRQRGVFKELARGVERELNEGKVSIQLNRSDLAKIVTFERSQLTGLDLSEGAADAPLAARRDSQLLREWP